VVPFVFIVALLLPAMNARAQAVPARTELSADTANAGPEAFASGGDDAEDVVEAGNPLAAPPPQNGFWARWFVRAKKIEAEQPHWVTPLVTTTPRLEQRYRYDIVWQGAPNGAVSENYGNGKGLTFIPAAPIEFTFSQPAYVVPNQPGKSAGFGDLNFQAKYRLFAANEENGNYIVTMVLLASVPTGHHGIGASDAIISPTVVGGKGFGRFDFQSSLGFSLPTGAAGIIGRSMIANTTLQYHLGRFFWPEVESNTTYFLIGPHAGRTQEFITPGLVLGRLRLYRHLRLTVGGGMQTAVSHFHASNHNWILSVRFPF
jgi:hypothetical protein